MSKPKLHTNLSVTDIKSILYFDKYEQNLTKVLNQFAHISIGK